MNTCETKYKKISYESLKVKTTFIIACRNGVLRSEGVLRSYIQETEAITPILHTGNGSYYSDPTYRKRKLLLRSNLYSGHRNPDLYSDKVLKTKCRRPFKLSIIVSLSNLSLKYQRLTPPGCKNIWQLKICVINGWVSR